MAQITKAQLIKLQKKLKSDSAIGAQYGISRQAIHQLRKKYGIPSLKAKNADRNEKVVKAKESGMSGAAIAKKFGISISQVYRILSDASPAKKGAKKVVKKKAAKKVAKKKVVKKAAKKVAKKKVVKKVCKEKSS